MKDVTAIGRAALVAKDRADSASPVQGAASASDPDAHLSEEDRAEVKRVRAELSAMPIEQVIAMTRGATGSASGAKGAAEPDYCPACELPADAFKCCGAPNCAVRDYGPGDARTRRAALADRSPAVQPSGTVQALVVGVTPGMGRIEIEFGGDVPEWADLGLRIRIATPAPEQEAAPKNGEDGYLCPAGKAQAAVREVVQVAPPGAQQAVAGYVSPVALKHLRECMANGLATSIMVYARPHDERTTPLYADPAADIIMEAAQFKVLEFNAKQGGFDSALHAVLAALTAPVPATTPAEQPEATADTLRAIRDEITGYYRALDSRQHGGVAQNKAFMSIESALGMCWEAHRAAIKANN